MLLGKRRRVPDDDVHIPHLCDAELVAMLSRLVRRRELEAATASELLATYLRISLTRHSQTGLLPRVLELRANFSAYDAVYVALAEALRTPLLTDDARLSSAVRRHLPHVALA